MTGLLTDVWAGLRVPERGTDVPQNEQGGAVVPLGPKSRLELPNPRLTVEQALVWPHAVEPGARSPRRHKEQCFWKKLKPRGR